MRDYERYTKEYINDGFEQKYQIPIRKKRVLESIQTYAHRKVLEIGCGPQLLISYVKDFESWTIVEPSQEFVRIAEKEASNSVEIILGCFEDKIEYLKQKNFDMIIASSILHEVEHPDLFLEKIIDICQKETVVHINVPNANSFHRLLAVESGFIKSIYEQSQRNKELQQHSIFSMDSLIENVKNVTRKANKKVEILNSGGYFIKPFTHAQMEECVFHGILNEKIMEGLNGMVKYMPHMASEIFIDFRCR